MLFALFPPHGFFKALIMKPFLAPSLLLATLTLQSAVAQQVNARNITNEPLFFKVQLDSKAKVSSLKPGDSAEGSLARDVYSPDGKVFGAGAKVRLTVDHLERLRKAPSNRWPWVVKVFTPRHVNSPAFTGAIVSAPDGAESRLHVSLVSTAPTVAIDAQSGKKKPKRTKENAALTSGASGASSKPNPAVGPTLAFEARVPAEEVSAHPGSSMPPSFGTATVPAGTVCRILLLGDLFSSRNKTGDSVRARLLEPILLESHLVVPAGSLFEGKVAKAVPPRWLSRAGSLNLTFTSIILSDGDRIPITASVVGVELNRGSHTKLDAEGRLRGERPGVAWMLIDGGVTAGISKEVDDGTQLVIEAILSSATDASTAGTARIAASIVSGIFMLTRRGRDVILPDHTEMNIMLNRPATTGPALAARATP